MRSRCHVVRDTIQLDDEAMPERVLPVLTPRGAVEVLLDSSRVRRLRVTTPTLRTADSLGVGSTLAQLLRASGARGVEGERGLFVVPAGRCGLSLHLDYAVPNENHYDAWSATDLARLAGYIRVDEMLATACLRSAGTRWTLPAPTENF